MYKERKKDYIRPLDIATHMYKETKKEIVQDHCYMASFFCCYCDNNSLNTWCLLLQMLCQVYARVAETGVREAMRQQGLAPSAKKTADTKKRVWIAELGAAG